MAGPLERTLNRLRAAAGPGALGGALRRAVKHADRSRGVYPALGELAGRYRAAGAAPPDLTAFELRVFSQNGEDGVLAEILRRIGVAGGGFVEFGVQDGTEGNTVFLAHVLGWAGVYLEADDAGFAALERRWAASARVRTVHAAVEPDTVQALFAGAGVPEEPDVVSIDVDGNDYWIWRALTRYRPRVVVIEYNGALEPGRRLVQPRDTGSWRETEFYGASLEALVALGERKGYRLVHCEMTGNNAFFLRDDLPGEFVPAGQVARRRSNFSLAGIRHAPDPDGRQYVDLDAQPARQAHSEP
jgi:hypothetical protein